MDGDAPDGTAGPAAIMADEDAARRWLEALRWPDGRRCPGCGGRDTHACVHADMPYRCRSCRRYFGVRTGTAMARSPLPLGAWLAAIRLEIRDGGATSVRIARELGITQKSAWTLRRRIRDALASALGGTPSFEGAVLAVLAERADPAARATLARLRPAEARPRCGRGYA